MFVNASEKPIAYRDDAGKHHVAPGETFDLVGPQHAPAVLAIPRVLVVATDDAARLEAVPGEPLREVPESAHEPDAVSIEADDVDDEPDAPARKGRR